MAIPLCVNDVAADGCSTVTSTENADGTVTFAVKTSTGLTCTANGLALNVAAGSCMNVVTGADGKLTLSPQIAPNSGLECGPTGLRVKLGCNMRYDATGGIISKLSPTQAGTVVAGAAGSGTLFASGNPYQPGYVGGTIAADTTCDRLIAVTYKTASVAVDGSTLTAGSNVLLSPRYGARLNAPPYGQGAVPNSGGNTYLFGPGGGQTTAGPSGGQMTGWTYTEYVYVPAGQTLSAAAEVFMQASGDAGSYTAAWTDTQITWAQVG